MLRSAQKIQHGGQTSFAGLSRAEDNPAYAQGRTRFLGDRRAASMVLISRSS